MPKYYCDYCDVFLTHDSSSVRKAHNAGRNHLTNVKDYYAGLGGDKAQDLIDQITQQYERGGPRPPMGNPMANPMAMGGPPIGFGGPPGGFGGPPPGFPGFGPPPGDFGGPPPFSGPPPSRNQFVAPEPGMPLGKPPIDSSSGPAKPPFINPERAAALGL